MQPLHSIIDLTHELTADTPTWDGSCGFSLKTEVDYNQCAEPDLFRVQSIAARAGIGTHIDAPAHCVPGAKTVDQIKLTQLIVPCVVIKLKEHIDQDYQLMPEDIQQFEAQYGRIPSAAFVIVHTGWSRYWKDPARYRNNLQFPSIHQSSAQLLLQREVVGLGTDTLSADAGGKSFPVHREILSAGKYLVENIANADQVKPIGAQVLIMPASIKGATEAPVRMAVIC